MRMLPAGRMLCLTGMMLVASGCHSAASLPTSITRDAAVGVTLPKNDQAVTIAAPCAGSKPANVLRPGMELEWAVHAKVDQADLVRGGKTIIGPDGSAVLGPYGNCPLAGLTLEQAGPHVEKHLASYLRQPRVVMRALHVEAAERNLASKQKLAPGVRGTAFQEPLPMPKVHKDEMHVLGPQQPLVPQPALLKHGPVTPFPAAPNEGNPVRLEYRIRPPDVLWINSLQGLVTQPVRGPHTVRPDGTVGVGIYGSVPVAGLTLEEAHPLIARAIFSKMAQGPEPVKDEKGDIIYEKDDKGDVIKDKAGKPKAKMTTPPTLEDVVKGLNVDIAAYNSSVYYVVMDAAGLGEQVYRFPITGYETVLDAISLTGGLQYFSSPHRIWVARCNFHHAGPDAVLPVDWRGITRGGQMATNWQVMPGDRIYVQADQVRCFSNNLAKFLEPVEKILGVTLLGSQTVNSIRGTNTNTIR